MSLLYLVTESGSATHWRSVAPERTPEAHATIVLELGSSSHCHGVAETRNRSSQRAAAESEKNDDALCWTDAQIPSVFCSYHVLGTFC